MTQTTSVLTADQIQTWLITKIAEQLEIQPKDLDPRSPLDSYGLDSAQIMLLMMDTESLLGYQPSPLLLWHYQTIEALSQRLADDLTACETEVFEL